MVTYEKLLGQANLFIIYLAVLFVFLQNRSLIWRNPAKGK